MQPGQIEKIKNLIKSSPILTSGERAEWLSLLEIMNDKQVLELERILSAHHAPQAQPPASPKAESVRTSHPPLGHIVNAPGGIKQQNAAAKKFDANLHRLLEEKELKPGKPEFELELPENAGQENAGHGFRLEEKKKSPAPPAKSSVPLNAFLKPEAAQGKPGAVAPAAKENAAPAAKQGSELFHAELHSWEDIERFVSKSKAPAPAATNTPDAVFSKVLQKATDPVMVVKPVPQGPAAEPVARQEQPAWSLKNPSELTVTVFTKVDLKEIIDKLRVMVKNRGYHEVLFDLEKSPVYNLYLETGAKILKEGMGFEKLQKDQANLGKRYLNRKEFENFTDLLRQIQVS